MENTSNEQIGEEKWSREELIKFCLDGMSDIQDGDMDEYKVILEQMTWEDLDKEADWVWELMGK